MSRHLLLELRLLFASPLRIVLPVLAPLAPLLMGRAGLLEAGMVEPLFILAYQFLMMTYLPWLFGLSRGGWRLVWLIRPSDSIQTLSLSYLGLLALTSALPLAAFYPLKQLMTPAPSETMLIPLAIYTLSIGVLHQSITLLLLSLTRETTVSFAAVLTYQALLITLSASLLADGLRGSYGPLALVFPVLLAMESVPSETLLAAALLCAASSLVFTYFAVRERAKPSLP